MRSVTYEVPEIVRVPVTVQVQNPETGVVLTLSLMSVAVEVPEVVPVPNVFLVPVPDTSVAG